jgi:radical SAM superfamily enzyme YgiQ (UPF0313 family)
MKIPSLQDVKVTNVNLTMPYVAPLEFQIEPSPASRRKVVLINPPSIVSRFATVAELVPPIGLAYLGAVLRKGGHDVQIIDAVGEKTTAASPYDKNLVLRGMTFEEVVERIDPAAEVIGLSGMFSSQWPHYKALLKKIRAAFPHVLLVGGGEHFSAMPEFSLETCASLDVCVVGEGEFALLDLVNSLGKANGWEGVSGLAYRQEGRVVVLPRVGRIKNVDDIPWPAWDLIPLENYLAFGFGWGVGNKRAMPMIATRGCPFQCTFCSSPYMWTTRWLARDPDDVLDEIEHYQKIYGIDEVQFYDLTAIIKKEWIVAFCKGLLERRINIVWQLPIGTRSEVVDSEVADWLYKSGCTNMGFAPESGSPVTLKRIKKKVDLDNMKKSIRGCVKRGLNVKANIILGFPGQTHWEIWQSLWFGVAVSWLGVHDISFFPFSPYPGSELFNDLKDAGRLPDFTDEWFLSLSYVELAQFRSYCEDVSERMLRIYQLLGFSLFYGSQYVFRPWRFARTVRNLVTGQHESKGEQALSAMIKRVAFRAG